MSEKGITITATEWTVSAREKISTGDYENFEPHVTIKGEVPMRAELDEAARTELKARLLAVHKEAQEIVERAGENRIAVEDAEDWGVRNVGTGQEDST